LRVTSVIHLGGAELFVFLHQAQAVPHNLAGGAVPATFDQALDEFFEERALFRAVALGLMPSAL
jgi:hypothetical protein